MENFESHYISKEKLDIQKTDNPKEISKKGEREEKYIARIKKDAYVNLHQHTGVSGTFKEKEGTISPKEILKQRENEGASNCAGTVLEPTASLYLKTLKNNFFVKTDHFSDGYAGAETTSEEIKKEKIKGVIGWFEKLYKNYPELVKQDFGKENFGELTTKERQEIEKISESLMYHGDKRAELGLKKVKEINKQLKIGKILFGFECNVIPDNNGKLHLDAENFIKTHKNEITGPIIGSLHVCADPCYEKFKDATYQNTNLTPELAKKMASELTEKIIEAAGLGINILAHTGYGIHPEITNNLDWPRIAEALIENNAAFEINIQNVMKEIGKTLIDIEKFPISQINYREHLIKKLEEDIIPFMNSKKIMNALKPYFKKGLKIAINTDEHKIFYQPRIPLEKNEENKNLFPESRINLDKIKNSIKQDPENLKKEHPEFVALIEKINEIKSETKTRVENLKKQGKIINGEITDEKVLSGLLNRRFWNAIKIIEYYFNNKFKEYEISKDNIINLFSPEKLKNFLNKQTY